MNKLLLKLKDKETAITTIIEWNTCTNAMNIKQSEQDSKAQHEALTTLSLVLSMTTILYTQEWYYHLWLRPKKNSR